eukprot:scaffold3929_cov291-Pinguiococcus_pyrenoidosus.AAC.8
MVAAGWVRSGDGSSRCSFAPRFPEPPVPEERKPSSFLGLGWLLGYGKKYSSAQLRAEETPTVDGFVNHAIARDLLSLVTLLYATCADPSCHVRSGEAPSAFVERVRREADISKVLGLRKDALVESVERIIHRGPDMLKLDFLGLPQTTDLQVSRIYEYRSSPHFSSSLSFWGERGEQKGLELSFHARGFQSFGGADEDSRRPL